MEEKQNEKQTLYYVVDHEYDFYDDGEGFLTGNKEIKGYVVIENKLSQLFETYGSIHDNSVTLIQEWFEEVQNDEFENYNLQQL